jgi:hypothetical protein
MWNILGEPVVKGGQNLPPLIGIGLTGFQNIGGGAAPPAQPVPASLIFVDKETKYFCI